MKDIMDIYEESKFPTLLGILFVMIIAIEITLVPWITFMAPLHIGRMPYLRIPYMILVPLTFILPLVDLVAIKKATKHLLMVNTIYLSSRAIYFTFYFINEIQYRIAENSDKADGSNIADIVWSGIFCIMFTLIFSIAWIVLLNVSKNIKYYIKEKSSEQR
jgi:hypothetical protein